jgi:hypothetical protein
LFLALFSSVGFFAASSSPVGFFAAFFSSIGCFAAFLSPFLSSSDFDVASSVAVPLSATYPTTSCFAAAVPADEDAPLCGRRFRQLNVGLGPLAVLPQELVDLDLEIFWHVFLRDILRDVSVASRNHSIIAWFALEPP